MAPAACYDNNRIYEKMGDGISDYANGIPLDSIALMGSIGIFDLIVCSVPNPRYQLGNSKINNFTLQIRRRGFCPAVLNFTDYFKNDV